MPVHHRDENVSYQKLRTFIGATGIMLPVLAVAGCFFFGAGVHSFQESISHYFYSVMHIVFVAVLCMLGGFLLSYRGKDKWESMLSNLAGICAICIAAFPTAFAGFLPETNPSNQYLQIKNYEVSKFWGNAHFVFAATLFACFIVFCFYFFQKPDDNYNGKAAVKWRRRRIIYYTCGGVIAASLLLIVIFMKMENKTGIWKYSTFIFETTALWAFGIAWLVKGSDVLKNIPVIKFIVKPIR